MRDGPRRERAGQVPPAASLSSTTPSCGALPAVLFCTHIGQGATGGCKSTYPPLLQPRANPFRCAAAGEPAPLSGTGNSSSRLQFRKIAHMWAQLLVLLLASKHGCAFLLPTASSSSAVVETAGVNYAAASRCDTSSSVATKRSWSPEPSEPSSVYVNLPFCRRRCFYCDFPIKVQWCIDDFRRSVIRGCWLHIHVCGAKRRGRMVLICARNNRSMPPLAAVQYCQPRVHL